MQHRYTSRQPSRADRDELGTWVKVSLSVTKPLLITRRNTFLQFFYLYDWAGGVDDLDGWFVVLLSFVCFVGQFSEYF